MSATTTLEELNRRLVTYELLSYARGCGGIATPSGFRSHLESKGWSVTTCALEGEEWEIRATPPSLRQVTFTLHEV